MQNVLESVHEGMKVVDSRNHEIGTVEYIKMVEIDPATGQPIANDIEEDDDHHETLLEVVAEAFHDDDIPEEIQERLLHDGFIRMDADGLFNADRYVLPDQISGVSGGKVMLKVSKDQLQKAH
jgi:hypothetical protein